MVINVREFDLQDDAQKLAEQETVADSVFSEVLAHIPLKSKMRHPPLSHMSLMFRHPLDDGVSSLSMRNEINLLAI